MAFERETLKEPKSFSKMDITISKYPEGGELQNSIKVTFWINDQEGRMFGIKEVNLVPHMTPAQITAVQDFANSIWNKGEQELLVQQPE